MGDSSMKPSPGRTCVRVRREAPRGSRPNSQSQLVNSGWPGEIPARLWRPLGTVIFRSGRISARRASASVIHCQASSREMGRVDSNFSMIMLAELLSGWTENTRPAWAGLGYSLEAGDALALLLELAQCLFRFGELGALLVEHLGRRLGDEALVGQLAADPADLAVQALDFLVQARQFSVLVDQPGHGHQHFHLADQGGGGHRGL